ncbi:MAG TPA: hypothetical protein VFX28_20245, partial [Methylomirabilota bacterium]|nr:hypothetical protein [Methylomirabilota bacterium]
MGAPAPGPGGLAAAARPHFPALAAVGGTETRVFADNSSTTQVPAQALAEVARYFHEGHAVRGQDPALDFPRTRRPARLLDEARAAAAGLCGAEPEAIG